MQKHSNYTMSRAGALCLCLGSFLAGITSAVESQGNRPLRPTAPYHPAPIRLRLKGATMYEALRGLRGLGYRVHDEQMPIRTARDPGWSKQDVELPEVSLDEALDRLCEIFQEHSHVTCQGQAVVRLKENSALDGRVVIDEPVEGKASELAGRFLKPHGIRLPGWWIGPAGARRPGDHEVELPAGNYTVAEFLCAMTETEPNVLWSMGGSVAGRILSFQQVSAYVSVRINVSPQTRAREARGRIASGKSPAGKRVTIPDRGLEVRMREAIGKRKGELYESDLEAIDRLDCFRSRITDLTGLEGCPNLIRLNLTGNSITDLTPITAVTTLLTLRLLNNSVSDISPFSELRDMCELGLEGNRIRDISPLAEMKNLWRLDLRDNSVSDISALSDMRRLEKLNLENNSVADIAALSGCTSLKELNLRNNSVTDLSALSKMTSLEELWLQNNAVRDLSPLTGLPSLTTLYLDGNLVEDLSPLASLPRLKKLSLQNCGIRDISALAGMTGIERLVLGMNSIADLSPLAKLTNLRDLGVGRNSIAAITPLVENCDAGGLGRGCNVHITSNPLSEKAIREDIPYLNAHGVEVWYDTPDGRSVILEGVDSPWKTIATEGAAKEKVQPEEEALTEAEIERLLDKEASFELIETPISEVVPFLQRRSGIKMVLDPETVRKLYDPRVSLKVSNMTWRKALKKVLAEAGLGYAMRDDAILISTPEALRAEPEAVQTGSNGGAK